MVSATAVYNVLPHVPVTNAQLTLLFRFAIAAIYLAKRNIRKKGILELHEQVTARARDA